MELILLEKEKLVVKARDLISKEKWEGFAKGCPQFSVFQTVEFALATGKMSRFAPTFLTAEDIHGHIYAGTIVFVIASKNIFLKFLSQIYAFESPLFLADPKGLVALDALLEGMNKYARRIGAIKIEIVPRFHNLESQDQQRVVQRSLAKHNYRSETVCTVVVDLNKPLDQLWKNISRGRKAEINAARRNKLEVTTETVDIEEYYRLHHQTYRRLGIRPESHSFFDTVWSHLVNTGQAKVFSLRSGHHLVAAILVLIDIDRNTIYGWIGESDSTYWRLRPNDLLVWGIIELGKKLGYGVFDLVQYYPDNPKDKFYSLYVFKRSFGKTVWVQKYVEVFSQPKLAAWDVFRTIYKFAITRVMLPF